MLPPPSVTQFRLRGFFSIDRPKEEKLHTVAVVVVVDVSVVADVAFDVSVVAVVVGGGGVSLVMNVI